MLWLSTGANAFLVPTNGSVSLSIVGKSNDAENDKLTYRFEILDESGNILKTISGMNGTLTQSDLASLPPDIKLPAVNYSVRMVVSDGMAETSSIVKAFQVETAPNFYVDTNGVTVKCENAAIGEEYTFQSGVYSGRLFRAVSNEDLRAKSGTSGGTPASGALFTKYMEEACTTQVTDLHLGDDSPTSSYYEQRSPFYNTWTNPNIEHWDVGNVIDMNGLFHSAVNFTGNLSSWDVSKVKNMNKLFATAGKFNSDLSGWDVSSVETMRGMFMFTPFNNSSTANWKPINVTNMDVMYMGNFSFNQDISSQCVPKISSKPATYDMMTNFMWSTAKKPKWGVTCP